MNQDPYDDFDWNVGSSPTPSANTGPSFDHTMGNETGHYLYIEASGREMGQKAIITTPFIPNEFPGHVCVRFYYHMYGANIGTLNVYIGNHGNQFDPLMWSMTGESGNEWLKADVDVRLKDVIFMVTFEGIVGSSYLSDIAIDDINVLYGLCSDID
ncbi:thyroid hormone-induced protein B-like [Saccoglossus kowalevskii]